MVRNIAVARPIGATASINKVLRNTYLLLSLTLAWSAITAGLSMALNVGAGVSLLSTFGALGLVMFALPRTANSAAGLGVVFGITGLLGFGLGPMLSAYLSLPNGPQLVMTALGGTAVICLGLSAYALTSRRDFTFLGGFLVVGLLLALVASLANLFLQIPVLALATSAVVILIMSGFILYDTSRIVNGGETNYVLATVGLYLSMFNIFISLLQLLGIFSGDD
ncbi:MAG: Bax inhibitor-1/YccA family protein [Gammaproteobacteria bacterium]|nr:Bax inhibitor-1/YccA family protein [Gammaproteobacteria bacterium]